MKTLFIICLLLPMIASAALRKYDLKLSYSLEEGPLSKRKIIVQEGKMASMSKARQFVEVTAEEGIISDRKGILLSFNVGVMDKNGKRKILTQPKLLVKENEKAKITIDEFALAVTANRVK
jgi:type II secretory pathway component GspD/PulD (secretin)